MGNNRDLYFDKHIKNTPDADSYLKALAASPYKTHRRIAKQLHHQYVGLMKSATTATEGQDTNADENTKKILSSGNTNNSEERSESTKS